MGSDSGFSSEQPSGHRHDQETTKSAWKTRVDLLRHVSLAHLALVGLVTLFVLIEYRDDRDARYHSILALSIPGVVSAISCRLPVMIDLELGRSDADLQLWAEESESARKYNQRLKEAVGQEELIWTVVCAFVSLLWAVWLGGGIALVLDHYLQHHYASTGLKLSIPTKVGIAFKIVAVVIGVEIVLLCLLGREQRRKIQQLRKQRRRELS